VAAGEVGDGGRGGRWLLYPVIALLALASIGGGYQTWVQQPMPRRIRCLGN
jgi:hypothetical protein